ncbi:hypothetical protein FB45DRAFT_909378 [Roridomyces roridus]|uniref:F-box domain-containing protein n=1 Tax=Roridomyces roridus TaxID=1738132 RepID=A0AAD7BYW9_9AGAR|nr:hypothetical protein FB45DRAFT_909378 [Roridomyces roridus]
MTFEDLPEDIIRSILSFCDIRTVLAVGRTTRYNHRLSVEKLVWVDLVQDLRHRGFIDCLSHSDIQSLSQEALVALVRRILTGPASWNLGRPSLDATKSSFISRLKRQPSAIFLKKTSDPPATQPEVEISARRALSRPGAAMEDPSNRDLLLLSGGEYLIARSRPSLECWNIPANTLVWSRSVPEPLEIFSFAAEVLGGGDGTNILICQTCRFGVCSVEIVNLHFQTGLTNTLFSNLYPDPANWRIKPRICGNIACIGWECRADQAPPKSFCILIDWKRMLHLKLAPDNSQHQECPIFVNLIRDHVFFVANNRSGSAEIRLFDIAAFSAHWRPTADPAPLKPVYTTDIPTIVCEKITKSWYNFRRRFDLHAHESPVEEGRYRVWLCLSGFTGPKLGKGLSVEYRPLRFVYGYSLSLKDKVHWQQAAAPAADNIDYWQSGTSYSGHKYGTLNGSGEFGVFRLADASSTSFVMVGDSQSPHHGVQISPYSGALTYYERDLVVVTYYK